MDAFGRQDLLELLERATPPAVSIYLSTHRAGAETDADRLRFREAVRRARDLLTPEWQKREIDTLLEPLEPLYRDERFWRFQADGLAVFRCPGMFRTYRLPWEFSELVVVGANFHTRPLLRYLQMPERYWLLMLSEKEVRLWQGSASGISPVDLGSVPRSLTEALGVGFERDDPIVITRKDLKARHGSPGPGGYKPVFHGHGMGPNDSEPEMRAFFRKVDAGLREVFDGDRSPLILAAPEERNALFRSISHLPNLTEEGIVAGVRDWAAERLHQTAWPIACRAAHKEVGRALELWERAAPLGKTEPDLTASARLAVAGRVRLLMLERNRHVWGFLDRQTGDLRAVQEGGEDPGPWALDVLDELAEVVLLHGGEVLSVPAERMPTGSGAAAVLR